MDAAVAVADADDRECWVGVQQSGLGSEAPPRKLPFECHPAKFSAGFAPSSQWHRASSGRVVFAEPLDGCGGRLRNAGAAAGQVLVLKRGGCTFGDKAQAVVGLPEPPAAVLVVDSPDASATNSAGAAEMTAWAG